jgi:putative aldouronate transport system substrate-binding protein
MKRTLVFLSVFLLIAGTLMARGVDEGSGTTATTGEIAANSWETDTTPITLSIYVDITVDPIQYWDQQEVKKIMVKDTGVDLDWIPATDNNQTMLNILIASGDYPDFFYVGGNIPAVVELADAGELSKLNELGEKYAPDFMPYMTKEYPNALLAARLEFDSMDIYKANLYTIPKSKFNDPLVAKNLAGVHVIKEVYDELGDPPMNTAEDMLNVLRMVKQSHPEMLPAHPYRYTGTDAFGSPTLVFANYANAGIAGGVTEQDGTYKFFYTDPNFLALLKVLNTMYNEGLVNKDVFTEGRDELLARLYGGKVFMQMFQDADNFAQFQGGIDQNAEKGEAPAYHWESIPPWTLNSSIRYGYDSLGGGVGYGAGTQGIAIYSGTKYPARAIRQIDYWMSDYFQKLMLFGVEGKHYFINDKGLPEFTDLGWQIRTSPDNTKTVGLGGLPWWMRQDWYKRVMDYYDALKRYPAMADAIVLAGNYYKDLSKFGGITNFPPNSDELKIFALVKEAYTNAVIDLIVGPPSNVERAYNNMIAELNRLGLDKLNDYVATFEKEKSAKFAKYSVGLDLPK